MWKFRFVFEKKYGYWHCSLPLNDINVYAIKAMFCYDIANSYLKTQKERQLFCEFILAQNIENYNDFFKKVDQFAVANNLIFKMNSHTEDFSPTRKLTSKIFQYGLVHLAKKFNINNNVKLSNGVSHDVFCNNIKIDAKTKNGNSKFFNKDFEITTAYNTEDNNNNADFYCFGVCAKKYWQQDNIINFVIAGVIKKQQFYNIARKRVVGQVLCNRRGQPTLQYGKQMLAKKEDYVTYAEYLHPIETIF